MKLGIFTSFDGSHQQYIDSCEELKVDYEVIDILSSDWVNNVIKSTCDGYLCSSCSDLQERKSILDERFYFIENILKKLIYPSFNELYIHENKRNMAAWLEIHNFPHPKTNVFVNKNEAIRFLSETSYPLIMKANLGSGASKVRIIKTSRKAKYYVNRIFPRFPKLNFLNLGLIYSKKIKGIPLPDFANSQKNYVLFQEYKRIIHEWRIIKIGDSFFGHQKLLKGDFASGSGLVGWVAPPKELLFMVKDICEKGNFFAMAIDIFETEEGNYYINELQTSFGSYLNSQMIIDGVPGRYIFENGDFVFKQGVFNTYGSKKLRVEHLISIINKK